MIAQHTSRLVALLGGVVSLAGCMSLSGLSGNSSYACKAPDGVTCQSVSGTYANAVANNLPAQRTRATPTTAPVSAPPSSAASAPAVRHASADAAQVLPLRSAPRILRLWFKPWEDVDRDLYDQGYVYVQVDGGRWLVDHAQRAIREAYAPVRAPPDGGPPTPRHAAPPRVCSVRQALSN
ncbi:TraV family lipoprotein [Methylibium sp. T29]|uniref:TraV family lipoprotein n=1 Tax=Methylibium sp. T29 TaxID=1430884 RepID=UPI0003F41A43|nr:TraV family lipoprotein [Methylibium sp. T29]EWS56787.1 type IV conjugative transfer system protein TraV [Methylibium sp. T29]